jgi:hypothetical protein
MEVGDDFFSWVESLEMGKDISNGNEIVTAEHL